MSSSTSILLTTVSKQVTIYLGLPILIAGLIGGILNVIVFLSFKTFRENSCAFFLTIMSFVNVGQLLTGFLSRILISGFNLNWTETSVAYCKFRYYCLQVCALTSFTCMCLATIHQYLATSLRPRWQQFFNIKRAYLFCVLNSIIWLLHSIPALIYYSPTISSTTGSVSCSITNDMYQKYYSYGYTLVLAGILPILITVVFGYMAYWNVRQIPYRTVPLVRRELDKQLTSMVLIQVIHNFTVVVPSFCIKTYVYAANLTPYSPHYEDITFASLVLGLIYYLYFASPFYIYVCVSKRFRQQLRYVLIGVYLKREQQPGMSGISQLSAQMP